jgi:hypothetical protein
MRLTRAPVGLCQNGTLDLRIVFTKSAHRERCETSRQPGTRLDSASPQPGADSYIHSFVVPKWSGLRLRNGLQSFHSPLQRACSYQCRASSKPRPFVTRTPKGTDFTEQSLFERRDEGRSEALATRLSDHTESHVRSRTTRGTRSVITATFQNSPVPALAPYLTLWR